jgi:hypothetical protein
VEIERKSRIYKDLTCNCADTHAGDAMKKGISGGQKRRITAGFVECKIGIVFPCYLLTRLNKLL